MIVKNLVLSSIIGLAYAISLNLIPPIFNSAEIFVLIIFGSVHGISTLLYWLVLDKILEREHKIMWMILGVVISFFLVFITKYIIKYSFSFTDILLKYFCVYLLNMLIAISTIIISIKFGSKVSRLEGYGIVFVSNIICLFLGCLLAFNMKCFNYSYFEDGKKRELSMKNFSNEMDGLRMLWNNQGVLLEKGVYKDGFKEGKWQYFDDKGKLINVIDFDTVSIKIKYKKN